MPPEVSKSLFHLNTNCQQRRSVMFLLKFPHLREHLRSMKKRLISFGHGYSATAIAERLDRNEWDIAGTSRSAEGLERLAALGIHPLEWNSDESVTYLETSDAILTSIAPREGRDPVLEVYGSVITENAARYQWVGYLSTTGVYGDHAGGWVDETTPLTPSTERGKARVAAEAAWSNVPNLPLHIFRLAGIYGPGRGPFAKVLNSTAKRIIKADQVFSRIHVDDIAQIVTASLHAPDAGAIYNLCDDDPAPPQDVIAYAAELLGKPLPPAIPFDEADMSPMARSFYSESKRVDNAKIKREIGITLIHPDYKSGLSAMLSSGSIS